MKSSFKSSQSLLVQAFLTHLKKYFLYDTLSYSRFSCDLVVDMIVFTLSLLASGSDDRYVILWDPLKHKKLTAINTGHQGNIFSVKVSLSMSRSVNQWTFRFPYAYTAVSYHHLYKHDFCEF